MEFPQQVTQQIRSLTPDTLEACLNATRSHIIAICAVEDHVKRLVVEIVTKAVFCPGIAAVAAHLSGRLDQCSSKSFRVALLSQCESTFNTLGADPASWSVNAAIGLGSFIGALHAEGLLRSKILHSCMVRSMFGRELSQEVYVPSVPSLVFACTVYVSVEQAKGFSDRGQRSMYRSRMESLRSCVSPDCRERIAIALSMGVQDTPSASPSVPVDASPTASAGAAAAAAAAGGLTSPKQEYRHDPYRVNSEVDDSLSVQNTSMGGAASPPSEAAACPAAQRQPVQPTERLQQQQQPSPLTKEALADWVTQTAPVSRADRPKRSSARAPPVQLDLAQAYHDAAVFGNRSAAEEALRKHNVVVPQPRKGVVFQQYVPAQQQQQQQPQPQQQQYMPAGQQQPQQQPQQMQQMPYAQHPVQPQQPMANGSFNAPASLNGSPVYPHNASFPQQPQQQQQQQPPPPQQQQQQQQQPYPSPHHAPQQYAQPQQPQQPQQAPPAYHAPPSPQPISNASFGSTGAGAHQPYAYHAPPSPPALRDPPAVAAAATLSPQAAPAQQQERPTAAAAAAAAASAAAAPAASSPKSAKGASSDKGEEKVAETNIFEACGSRAEQRRLGNLIINRALQEGYNRSYGAARRKLARFCKSNGIGDTDQTQLVTYLNDLFLAGNQYRGLCLKEFVDAPTRLQDELQSRKPQPGGMKARRAKVADSDEVDSVYSSGTAGTETWGEQMSEEELDELSDFNLEESNRLRFSDYASSHGRASSMAGDVSVASEAQILNELGTPVQGPLEIPEGLQSISGVSVSSRRSSRASRTSSRSGICFSKLPEDITIDDRVGVVRADGSEQAGTVKYIGFPSFKDKGETFDGCWIGVSFDEAVGNHDGTVEGERYFVAKPQHGVFVRENKVIRKCDKVEGPVFFYPQHLTKRLLRFDIRPDALRAYGFQSGDVITATHTRYRGKGKTGTVVGVRHGLLYWRIEGDTAGACACKNTTAEIVDVLRRKKYRKVASETLKNHLVDITEAQREKEGISLAEKAAVGISDKALEKVSHLVDPTAQTWEGSLQSPTPAQGYQSWVKKLWRKKKMETMS